MNIYYLFVDKECCLISLQEFIEEFFYSFEQMDEYM